MKYRKRAGYIRAFISILTGAIIVLISTTISGNESPAYIRICPQSNSFCASIIRFWKPVEDQWNNFIPQWLEDAIQTGKFQAQDFLRQVQPTIAEFAENNLDLAIAIVGIILLLIGAWRLLRAIFRSINQFRSIDRSDRAKRERKLRKFFGQEPTRFRSSFFWLLLSAICIAITFWLNRNSPVSSLICIRVNWLCQRNEYVLVLDTYLPLVFLVLSGIACLRALYWLIPSLKIWITTPSSRQVNNWLGESITKLANESLSSLHLVGNQRRPTPEIILLPVPPIDEYGFVEPSQIAVENRDIVMKTGWIWGKQVAFYGAYYVTILQFDENKFAVYECDYSFIQDFAYDSKVYESQYDKIVAVSMSQISVSIPGTGARQKWAEVLGLSFPSGEAASIYIPNIESLRKAKSNDLPYTNAERVINVLRTKLGSKIRN